MVGLLDLPLELREPILLDVILDTTQKPPDDPLSTDLSEGYEVVRAGGVNIDSRAHILCKPLQRHSMPLLQVNQQIRDEVIHLMPRKLGQQIDDAKLDVLFVADIGQQLWVTWLSAPFPTRNVNTLHAEIRDIKKLRSISSDAAQLVPMYGHDSSGHDCRHWVNSHCATKLLKFLADFLQPRLGGASIYKAQTIEATAGSQIASRTIQNLAINIPFEQDQQDSPETRERCLWCITANAEVSKNGSHRRIPSGKRAALIFAQSLHDQLLRIFETPPTDWPAIFPRVIFEAIGTIHLKVAGRPFASMDLSKMLATIPRGEEWNEDGVSRAEFFQWKRICEEKRKDSGFKVIRSSIQEHELVGSAGLIASMLSKRCGRLVHDTATLSEDVAPFSTRPARNERLGFTGTASFIQGDGRSLTGNATFYYSTNLTRQNLRLRFSNPQPVVDHSEPYYPVKEIEELPEDGEVVLFKGEAIFFHEAYDTSTITSGDATFYGRAEEASTE